MAPALGALRICGPLIGWRWCCGLRHQRRSPTALMIPREKLDGGGIGGGGPHRDQHASRHLRPRSGKSGQANHVYITLDNRLDPDPSHPTGDHPCGAGTVHICTTEPDSRFIDVRLVQSGQPDTELAACADRNMRVGDNLQIDFFVYDPDGHLAQFELYATYDNSLSVPVLLDPAAQLVGGAPYVNASINIPSATSPGTPAAWNYGEALTMHVATSPIGLAARSV